ncbi:MAG: hypothetical protein FWE57_08465 [Chitinispirillia bacterium]|nr:hypothetical protein [Chitinispirillia bacterium]
MSSRYTGPEKEYLDNKRMMLYNAVKCYYDKNLKSSSVKLGFSQSKINDVIKRLHQREAYYKYYHNFNINQVKKISIVAYWILKYKPFRAENWTLSQDVNVHIAYRLIFYISIGYANFEYTKKYGNAEIKLSAKRVTANIENDLLHALSEHDITKEALMILSSKIKNYVCELANNENYPRILLKDTPMNFCPRCSKAVKEDGRKIVCTDKCGFELNLN